ncbi:uncharacterized protein LOC134223445 [Armigeres subalbatus]|uniref:uncharacterized protein LOC134223445 n=1 Tax=Armigeres subalbatus TaxID=124917 RepID=UPI002ED0E78A
MEQPDHIFNEENVIEQVFLRRCLYDANTEGYKDQPTRTKAWEEVGKHMNVKGEQAKEVWEKLRRCFMNAIKRRKSKAMPPWRYEQRMSFLYDHIDPSKIHGKYGSEDLSYYSEADDIRLADASGNNNSKVCDEIDIQAIIKPEPDKTRSLMEFIQPPSVSNCSMSDNDMNNDTIPGSRFEHVPGPSEYDEDDMVSQCSHRTKKRHLPDEPGSHGLGVKRQRANSPQVSIPNEQILTCVNDNDDVDLFFLSMAKTVKTLDPLEQAKAKLQISQIVLGAQIASLKRYTKQK